MDYIFILINLNTIPHNDKARF
uniref:Uncharacterized protein n=1 Tax=Anguilla anguilla TaxID=7936 RepID=A0A0E9TRN4_ANGAN